MFEPVFAFVGRHPRGFDGFVAVLWTVLSLSDSALYHDGSGTLRYLLLPIFAACGISLYWRRRHALGVFVFQAALVLVATVIDADSTVPAAMVCGAYSLGAYALDRRRSMIAFGGFVIAAAAVLVALRVDEIGDSGALVLVLAIAWIVGDNLQTRRAYTKSMVERAERAEALQDSLAQQAVAEERTRIARDLHDVVAHSMSLMVVQAGAARRVASTDPDASVAALEAIEAVGRNSLEEMRRILDVLRGDERAASVLPQPDLAALDDLIDEFRSAGLQISFAMTNGDRPLPPSVELTVYRIVQESLTNTLKHAGPATVSVQIDVRPEHVTVSIEDDGVGGAATNAIGSQRGLIGMRERVMAFGGRFTARPGIDGGFAVHASLPIESRAHEPQDVRQ